jgi:hypothetical protein
MLGITDDVTFVIAVFVFLLVPRPNRLVVLPPFQWLLFHVKPSACPVLLISE